MLGQYEPGKAAALKAFQFNREAISARGLNDERLDQLVFDLLMGVR
ncbi:MAG: hypothetical protein HY782_08845 [Chloroflexi bacterium]|nr:hypothetical protein [Chloroflexota bacterium]